MLDEGAPTSTGGVIDAMRLCDALARPLNLRAPREEYSHGWGTNCADAKKIKWSWDLMVEDMDGKPTMLTFDLVEGRSPLIIGLDVKRHADTMNRAETPSIVFRRPCDTSDRSFYTYIAKDGDGNDRIWFEIVPNMGTTSASLMGNTVGRREVGMVKKVHRLTHATSEEMKRLFKDARMGNRKVCEACDKVYEACDICTSSGRPHNSKKISLTHVNEGFNEEVQADYTVVYIKGEKYFVLNIVDAGTRYGERAIANSRDAATMMQMMETEWLYHHGAPKYFSADPEFCKPVFERFLAGHEITLRPRPSRSSHKNGRVERNNGVFKSVLSRLSKEQTNASPWTLVSRASFMTNLFHGSSILSAFQMARGYTPSVLGIPSTVVSQDLLDAHIETTAIRAIQRTKRAKDNGVEPKSTFNRGDRVWVFYKSSQQNIPVGWIEARVVEAHEHYVKCRRSAKGPPMSIAYEHVRLAPKSELTNELTRYSLEDELYGLRNDCDTEGEIISRLQGEDVEIGYKDHGSGVEQAGTVGAAEESISHNCEAETDTDMIMREIFGDETKNDRDATKRVSAFFCSTVIGDPSRDVGTTKESDVISQVELTSDEQKVLNEVYAVVGSDQVTRRHMECAPQWLVDKAVKAELDENWSDSYISVHEKKVAWNENIISAHFVYKVKTEEKGVRRLKARLCPHGIRDKMKDNIRKDSATAQFDVIRLICRIASVLRLRLGCIDVKGAYLQSGPITRDIYVRPPRECGSPRGVLWKLTKLPYGITEAGRQWAKVVEGWMTQEAGFGRVFGVPQLFVRRDAGGRVILLLAKVTDDMLIAGSTAEVKAFITQISGRFPISKAIVNDEIKFNGCDISQDGEDNIKISMEEYLREVKCIDIPAERKKHRLDKVTDSERAAFRSLAGEFVWAGSGALPPASFIGSWMQQRVPRLTVDDLIQANGMLKEMRDMKAEVFYRSPKVQIKKVVVTSFTDAAFNITKSTQYGQTGLVCGIRFVGDGTENDVYHVIDWGSMRQKRVCYSSYGAEILACTEGDDRGYNIKMSLASLFPKNEFTHELNVDSKGLYDTVTTLHEGRDYRLRQTVQRIRDSFESQELNVLRWVQGPVNVADGLTKRNTNTQRLLMRILNSGKLQLPAHETFAVDSERWI